MVPWPRTIEQVNRLFFPCVDQSRGRLYSLLGQEVEREMTARNREQFGFRVVDSPRIPDRISKPRKELPALMATLIAGFTFCIYYVARDRRKHLVHYMHYMKGVHKLQRIKDPIMGLFCET